MSNQSIVISGLPESGKTTYLAALWHLISDQEEPTELKFESIGQANIGHLNEIARRWRNAEVQLRTENASETKTVTMNLRGAQNRQVCLTFPDLSGESFREIWENRQCTAELHQLLRDADGLLLFVNADTIVHPLPLNKMATKLNNASTTSEENEIVRWTPEIAPTQVKIVDLLQQFRSPYINIKAKKIAVMLSAWDMAEGEQLCPDQYLSLHLPLLDQYLKAEADEWHFRVYGLSAQGGIFLNPQISQTQDELDAIAKLRDLTACERIKLFYGSNLSRDLTEPIAWLIS